MSVAETIPICDENTLVPDTETMEGSIQDYDQDQAQDQPHDQPVAETVTDDDEDDGRETMTDLRP